jgi:Dolichyl-phosphate-mannose-protein mannosyltransferase
LLCDGKKPHSNGQFNGLDVSNGPMAPSPEVSLAESTSLPTLPPARSIGAATQRYFIVLVLFVVACGVSRSMWATALDGFTFDEAYHIAAGASYLRFHDFRVNPEHPPLVKLIAGSTAPPSILHLSPPPHLEGKDQEREYAETAVYIDSNPQLIQRRARLTMYAFHSILFVVLALLLRRLFDPPIALLTLGILLLDPTVAAHMPVVMTDLPLALFGAISVALAALVLRDGRRSDALWLGLSCGLLLATKHSAPLIALPVAGGCVLYLIYSAAKHLPWKRTAALLAASAILAGTVLWGIYGFRYTESGTATQQFNRTLELKISDLQSLHSRAALTFLSRFHLAPRPYIWGLADTMRAGLEGRTGEVHVFGHIYETRPPHWVPLALVAIKIPLGTLAVMLAGVLLLLLGKLQPAFRWPLLAFLAAGLFFLVFVCLKGVPYAGVRHLLFLLPLTALFSGVALERIFRGRSRLAWTFAIAAVLAACVSSLPQRRIWEYHNLLAGGSANAWKYFNNESVDIGQRSTELIAFYKAHVTDHDGHVGYWISDVVLKSASIPTVEFDFDKPISADVSGWFFTEATSLSPHHRYDLAALREATPVVRYGNLMIYHGTYHLPGYVAGAIYWRAHQLTYLSSPDPVKAEALLRRVIELEPHSYTVRIELGNFALKRQDVPAAVSWYRGALQDAPPQYRSNIAEQIAKLAANAPFAVPPLHNPALE